MRSTSQNFAIDRGGMLVVAIVNLALVGWANADDNSTTAAQLQGKYEQLIGPTLLDGVGQAIHRDPARHYYYVPDTLLPRAIPGDQRTEAPNVAAEQLFELARQAADQQHYELAYRWSHEVLRLNPRHAQARRLVGVSTESSSIDWRTSRKPHPRYGWAANRYLQADTDHFRITTDQSREAVQQLAIELETLHCVWRQLFLRFWLPPSEQKLVFERSAARRAARAKHQVVLFRDRDQYVRFLQAIEPRAAITLGYYHAPSRTSFFFGEADQNRSTWLHEATHQLFHEATTVRGQVGEQQNFWILEGIAMYMESLQTVGAEYALGGIDAERLQFARFRALQEQQYLPTAELAQMGRAELQAHADLRALYSQSAGLTHFLLHGGSSTQREAALSYLQAIYHRTDRGDTLASLLGDDLEHLDRDYLEWLKIDDADLAAIDRRAIITALSLGGTSITDKGLLSLPPLQELDWFDVNHRPVTDDGMIVLANANRLTQLSAVGTAISDQGIQKWLPHAALRELDLSGTSIGDEATKAIAKCLQLESLRLTHTRVTDTGLSHLSKLKQLKDVDLSQSQVSQTAIEELRKTLQREDEHHEVR